MPERDPDYKFTDYVKNKVRDEMKFQRRREMHNAWQNERRQARQNKPKDPLRGVFWGLLLILLGILFFATSGQWITGWTWWEALLIGLGSILILDAIIHYITPSARSYSLGRLIPGVIILFIGLAFVIGFSQWWPMALVATGIALFFSSWVIQREVENRRLAQDTLSQSEIKYRHIIDNANSLIVEMDIQGNIIFINRFALEFFGYQESEMLGKNAVGTIFSPSESINQEKMIGDIVVHPDSYLHNEKESVLRNGEKAWIVWTNKPIYDEQNSLKEILCIGINRTEQKKAEEVIAHQIKERTAVEERNRLARDLHDAVSQTLFSASLIAEVLPKLWERNQDEGRRRLEEIRQLTRGALAEMRTLLLELRPVALKDAELGDLLKQLSESINGRARIPVKVEVQGHQAISAEVKTAFYRIAQEALNNVAKHSGASQAGVILDYQPNMVKMVVSDNGKGFDMQDIRGQSLGLGIMRERAREINAQLSVDSEVNDGTRITVNWAVPSGNIS
jgi:PAS domain S-box-containing protein